LLAESFVGPSKLVESDAPKGQEPVPEGKRSIWSVRDDSIRLYFREMRPLPLLSPAQEIDLCRRMEKGQTALRRAVARAPLAVSMLLAVAGQVQRNELPPSELIVPADGSEVDPGVLRTAFLRIRRVRRLHRDIEALRLGSRDGRRAASSREACRVLLLRRLAALERVMTSLPIASTLVDKLMAELRDRAAGTASAVIGLPDEALRSLLAELAEHEHIVRQCKRELTEANLRLVVSITKRYARQDLPFADLIQEGNIGLLKAVNRFQYRRGFKFSTYATWWIRQAVTRGLAEAGRTIRLPLPIFEAMQHLRRVRATLTAELGREPTAAELAGRSGLPDSKVRLILDSIRRPRSLETPVGEDAQLGDFLADPEAPRPDEAALEKDLTRQIERSLARLSDRERMLLQLRFGLAGGSEHTLEEIGAHFLVTRERIRQIEAEALRKLRHPAHSQVLRAFAKG